MSQRWPLFISCLLNLNCLLFLHKKLTPIRTKALSANFELLQYVLGFSGETEPKGDRIIYYMDISLIYRYTEREKGKEKES